MSKTGLLFNMLQVKADYIYRVCRYSFEAKMLLLCCFYVILLTAVKEVKRILLFCKQFPVKSCQHSYSAKLCLLQLSSADCASQCLWQRIMSTAWARSSTVPSAVTVGCLSSLGLSGGGTQRQREGRAGTGNINKQQTV